MATTDDSATYLSTQLTTPPPDLRSTGGYTESEHTATSVVRKPRNMSRPNASALVNEASTVATRTPVPGRASGSDDPSFTTFPSTAGVSSLSTASKAAATHGDADVVPTARRDRRSITAVATAAGPTSSAQDGVQREVRFPAGEEEDAAKSSASGESSEQSPPKPSGSGRATRSPRQSGETVSSRRRRSNPAASEENQLESAQTSTIAPESPVGITTAFSGQNSRGEISSSRGRAFRGSEFATEEAEELLEEEGSCPLGHCSSDFLGTAPRTEAAGALQYGDGGNNIREFLDNDSDGGENLRLGVLQPEYFMFDSEDSGQPSDSVAFASSMPSFTSVSS